MEDLAVMGLGSVIRKLPDIYMKLRRLERFCKQEYFPDIVLTVDSKGFNLRLQSRLAGAPFHRMHVVGPSPWALRPIGKPASPQPINLSHAVDDLFVLLPFEPSWYVEETRCTFMGHPAVQDALPDKAFAPFTGLVHEQGLDRTFKVKLPTRTPACMPPATFVNENPLAPWQTFDNLFETPLPRNAPTFVSTMKEYTIAFFPGSREQELQWSLPLLVELASRLQDTNWQWQISSTPSTAKTISQFLSMQSPSIREQFKVIHDKVLLCNNADAAVAVSGTIASELALRYIPTLVVYDADWLTRTAAPMLARVKHVSLPNILADQALLPEFLFSQCQPEVIEPTLRCLLPHHSCQEPKYPHEKLRGILPYMAAWDESSQRPIRPSDVVAHAIINRLDKLASKHLHT